MLKSEPVASGLCFTPLSHLNLGWDPDWTLKLPFFPLSWSELLPLLEQSHGAGQCFSFENNVFPTNVILAPPLSKTLHPASRWHPGSQLAPGVNILAHLYHEPSEKFSSIKRKLIVNPRGVISPDVHALEKADFGCVSVDRNVGRMYHTRYQSEFTGGHGWFRLFGAAHIDCFIFCRRSPLQPELTPNQLVYDGRLLNYSSRLIPAAASVLRKARLALRKL